MLGVLHRAARGAVEFAGGLDPDGGQSPALAELAITVDGVRIDLRSVQLAWERALHWLPTFTCTIGSLVVRGTIFAPHGRTADLAGAVYVVSIENRGQGALSVGLALQGVLGHRQVRVRTPRSFPDAHQATAADDAVILAGAGVPGLAALAVGGEALATIEAEHDGPGTYSLASTHALEPQGRVQTAFYIGAGPEPDGALAAVRAMRRRGWRDLLTATRDALRDLQQSTGHEGVDRLVNRNLTFAYFYSVGRALDDAHYYLVRSRAPWHGNGTTIRDWDALAWIVPAVGLADPPLARELLLRTCELHGYAPGRGVNYLDGTLFEPGFSLEGAASYALAIDRYIRDSNDAQFVDEPVVADTLYVSADEIAARRHSRLALYSTEVTPSGTVPVHPYTLHGNAVAAQALDVIRRTLDEESAKKVEDPEAVRAALRRHFAGTDAKSVFADSADLQGAVSATGDPASSALWLPFYETTDRQDSVYRRTVKGAGASATLLAEQCARLYGPDAALALQWLRRAPLDNGVAAEHVDEAGSAIGNGGDAALSGLLAYSAWYAVHALGIEP